MEIDDQVCTMSNTSIIIIPNDIIIEIFSRMPAKSLLRLRWACKYFFDLITSDNDFIKKQLLHHHIITTTNDDDDDNRIVNNTSFWLSDSHAIIYTMNFMDVVNTMNFRAVDDYRYNYYDDYDYNDDDGTLAINMDCYNLPFSNIDKDDDYSYHFYFFNSCNGLILIKLDWNPHMKEEQRIYFLWNPCTTEVRELPHEPPNTYEHVNDKADYNYRILGLGYDHTIDDYKVVRVIFYYPQMADYIEPLYMDNILVEPLNMDIGIYTLRSNSWSTKIVTDSLLIANLREQVQKPGLLVNGALHFTKEWAGIGTITSFDIIREEFGEIEVPNREELLEAEGRRKDLFEPTSFFDLSTLNGCLCICQMPLFIKKYVIWMMKDYGVKDSWTKLFSINVEKILAYPSYNCRMYRSYSEPFEQYYKDGGILMVFNTNQRQMIIVACDSKKNDEPLLIYTIRGSNKCWFHNGTYIESLVSLNSGMYLTLAAGSTKLIFQKQDLLQYEVKMESNSGDSYLKWKDITRTE